MKKPLEKINIKILGAIEASADGRFAIVALLIAIFGILAGKGLGWW